MVHGARVSDDTASAQRSMRELVTDLTEQTSHLVRTEIQLAKRELTQHGKKAGAGIAVLAVGAIVGLFGVGTLLGTAVLLLTMVLPAWAATLIIGGMLVLVAAVLSATGIILLRRNVPPTPQGTIDNAKQDLDVLKNAVAHDGTRSRESETPRPPTQRVR